MVFTLVRQFMKMKNRVTDVTGMGLFRLLRNPLT
jgi:hypothetical protein